MIAALWVAVALVVVFLVWLGSMRTPGEREDEQTDERE